MTFSQWVDYLDQIAWGPWMLLLLVGTGIFISFRLGFLQFSKFGYAMKNTVGKLLGKQSAGAGEVTPMQAVSTALAATVGTGNIAGVTGAITVGGPGAVFWMWISALFGMATKYSEVVLAIRYRERNPKGEWVGGPMYYIKNGLGKEWRWLAVVFSLLGALAAFGIGNMTQVNTIAASINTVIDAYGGNTGAWSFQLCGQNVAISSLIVGLVVAAIAGMVLFGGMKRVGAVAEKLVPVMAIVYIVCSLWVIFANFGHLGDVFRMIFQGAFSPKAALGGAFGITVMQTIQKGVGRGVFSNEAGLGSAPIAHAASSETDPVRQGLYGIFEVFMDTIVICTMTALTLLCGEQNGIGIHWGESAGSELISASFGTVFGSRMGALLVALCLSLFALTTILSWALYGSRCSEFLFGTRCTSAYQGIFVGILVFGAIMKLEVVWNIADTLNGFMAIPNLIALLGMSGVVTKLTKDHFAREKQEL